jgi:hypothetical protein
MKSLKLLILFFLLGAEMIIAQEPVRRLNFLVSPRVAQFDITPISFQAQAKLMEFFHKGKMYVIIARSSEDMANQIIAKLIERKAMIGNIWFDSHGHFTRRRSLFEIGNEEFNYESIRDSCFTINLKKLAAYCDTNTNAGIGSCYGGATYSLPAVEEFPEQRMNGDSLMIGLSNVLNNATVYASESFVMTGPGIFNASYAFSGNPGRKKFCDPVYEPVWKKLGEWNCYSGKQKKFTDPLTVTLHQDGRISYKQKNYLEFEKNREKWVKKLNRLKRGNYNLANLYQEKSKNSTNSKQVGKGE